MDLFKKIWNNYFVLDELLVIRGLAALCVLSFHFTLARTDILPDSIQWLTWFDGLAAVNIFFVLSGYLITKVFLTGKYELSLKGILKFYKTRFIRIAGI